MYDGQDTCSKKCVFVLHSNPNFPGHFLIIRNNDSHEIGNVAEQAQIGYAAIHLKRLGNVKVHTNPNCVYLPQTFSK